AHSDGWRFRRRSCRRFSRSIRVVDHILQFLAGLEVRNLLGGNFHARAGLGISADARLPLARTKTAESADLDLIGISQRAHDAVEDRLHDNLGFLTGRFHYPGDLFNQIGFCHPLPSLQQRRHTRTASLKHYLSTHSPVHANPRAGVISPQGPIPPPRRAAGSPPAARIPPSRPSPSDSARSSAPPHSCE